MLMREDTPKTQRQNVPVKRQIHHPVHKRRSAEQNVPGIDVLSTPKTERNDYTQRNLFILSNSWIDNSVEEKNPFASHSLKISREFYFLLQSYRPLSTMRTQTQIQ